MEKARIVIVGAGISGLSCARHLMNQGVNLRILEKSSRPGGRCSSHKSHDDFYDHGAQYFTARTPLFKKLTEILKINNQVEELTHAIKQLSDDGSLHDLPDAHRYVGIPNMEAVPNALSVNLPIDYSTKVEAIKYAKKVWKINISRPNGRHDIIIADTLIFAIPADQMLRFDVPDCFKETLQHFKMDPCWAVMLGFKTALETSVSALRLNESEYQPLSWVMKKPDYSSGSIGERWVIHAGPRWSRSNLEMDSKQVISILFDKFSDIIDTKNFCSSGSKLWRYASGGRSHQFRYLADLSQSIIACGDWANGGRIEGAWTSGIAAAEHFLTEFKC